MRRGDYVSISNTMQCRCFSSRPQSCSNLHLDSCLSDKILTYQGRRTTQECCEGCRSSQGKLRQDGPSLEEIVRDWNEFNSRCRSIIDGHRKQALRTTVCPKLQVYPLSAYISPASSESSSDDSDRAVVRVNGCEKGATAI